MPIHLKPKRIKRHLSSISVKTIRLHISNRANIMLIQPASLQGGPETMKYNCNSLIIYSSVDDGETLNKALHCLTIFYSLLFISLAFSRSVDIRLDWLFFPSPLGLWVPSNL